MGMLVIIVQRDKRKALIIAALCLKVIANSKFKTNAIFYDHVLIILLLRS
jgi:hypothetical protein